MGWLAWRIPPLDQPGVPRESPGVPAPQFAMVFHGVAALTIPLTPPHRYKMVAAQQTCQALTTTALAPLIFVFHAPNILAGLRRPPNTNGDVPF